LDINEYLNELIEKAHTSNAYGEEPTFRRKPKKVKEDKPVLEIQPNNIQLEKEVVSPKEETVIRTSSKNDIQVVEINQKPKTRVLKNN
jgi:hypothetical protein